MNTKKKRKKNQRRGEKLADQAWEAADDDHLDLALKMIRRAVDLNPGNPVLWNDQGLFLLQCGRNNEAAVSFEAAITLAEDFAEAYANLSVIRQRQGKTEQAVALQRQAVHHVPESEQYRKTLVAYEALLGQCSQPDVASIQSVEETKAVTDDQLRAENPALVSKIEQVSWTVIQEQLTRHGYAHLPELVSPEHCESLREMFDDSSVFSRSVTMAKGRFGRGVYRYFSVPIPSAVDAIRRLVYPYVARIANAWQQLLDDDERYPLQWESFRNQCADAGQCSPSPIMLKYETGGFNAFHQDLRGEVYFPFQLLVVLSPRVNSSSERDEGFEGGDFLFSDMPQRRASDCRRIPAGLGDAVIFSTRDRIVRVGGAYGLMSVKHGMAQVTAGTRYALGLPFHEYE